jgi:hypothetical protein
MSLSGLIALLFLLHPPVPALGQTSYSWTSGTTGGTWATGTNWTPNGTPGGNSGDTANLGNVTANRNVTSSANNSITLNSNETISSLTFAQTSAFTNELQIQGSGTNTSAVATTLTVSNALTLGGNSSGTEILYLDGTSNDTGSTLVGTPTYAGAINIGTNGVLELGTFTGGSAGTVSGNVVIENGGTLDADQGVGSGTGSIAPSVVGNVTLQAGGTLSIGTANPHGYTADSTDTRFTVSNGNFLASGGAITVTNTVGVTGEIYLTGTSSSATFDSGVTLTNLAEVDFLGSNTGANAFTLQSDVALSLFRVRPQSSASSSVNVTIESVTPGNTLSIGNLAIQTPSNLGTSEVTLGGNVSITGAGVTISGEAGGTTGGSKIMINTNGNTLDVTAATSGSVLGQFQAVNNGANEIAWTLEGGGTVKASDFLFTPASGSNAGVSVNGATTLLAIGGFSGMTGSTSNLSNGPNSGTATSTIDPTSTFEYTGTGSGGFENFLTSNRAIGRLEVGDGIHATTLGDSGTSGSGLMVGGDITVNSNATFDLNGQNATESHVSGGTTGGLNGSGTVLNNTSGGGTLTLDTTGGNGSFSGVIENNSSTGGTIAVSKLGTGTQTFSNANTYTGGTTVSAGTLGVTGSLAATGALTVSGGGTFALGKAAGGGSVVNQVTSSLTLTTTTGVGTEAVLKFDLGATTNDSITTGTFNISSGQEFNLVLNETATPTINETLLTWTAGTGITNITSQVDTTGSGSGITDVNLSLVGDSLVFDATPVPEPDTWTLMLISFAGLAGWLQRRLYNFRT